MKAREFLAQQGSEVRERNLFKEPLSAAELRALAKRAGGIRELVGPKKRKEAEAVEDRDLAEWLAEDPARVRRPIIDTGDAVFLGFAQDVRERLA